jgi:enoyl-CoA hydratase/carnithine racemase
MSDLSIERPLPGVVVLRYNRPQTLNALDVAIRREIADQLTALADDDEARAVVLAGTERAFAAGADISEMSKVNAVEMHAWNTPKVWKAIAGFQKPLIAAVSGFALGGGCELAMHCDIVIAGQSARFGQPEVKVGIMPGAGGTQRLTRAAGKFRANLYLMTGRIFDAATALNMGLVSEVVADAEVEKTAIAIAGEIATLPPLSLKFIKEAVLLADNAPLEAALEFERRACQFLFSTEDKKEGMSAFMEKRRPDFKGR